MCCRVRLRKKKEMEEKKYRVGTMPLPEWEAREGFPQSIVFTGQVTMQEFWELAALFDYRKYRYIRFEKFQIEDFYDDEETGKTRRLFSTKQATVGKSSERTCPLWLVLWRKAAALSLTTLSFSRK